MSEPTVGRLRGLPGQLLRFTAVGGVGFVVDVAVFNLLLSHPLPSAAWPMIAKGVSTALAIAVNWIGNRLWTFRDRRRTDTAREAAEFLVASLVGSAASLLCLAVSHYALGFTSAVADNVSANVVGLAVGSAVRFAAYRWWVFADRSPERSPSASALVAGSAGSAMTTSAPTPGEFEITAVPPARAASLATIERPSPPPG